MTTSEVGRTDVSPVGIARLLVSRDVCASDNWAKEDGDAGGASFMGERKKSRDQDFGVVPGAFLEPVCRSCRVRVCCRVSLTSGDGLNSDGSMGTIDASGRFISSLSSLTVKAASRGPRRPTMETCFTFDTDKTSRTGAGMSYAARSEGDERNIRAISSETFPFPIKLTCESLSRAGGAGRDGCRVYQWTIEIAGTQCAEGGRAGWRVGRVQPVAKRI